MSAAAVTEALSANDITLLRNSFCPLERGSSRLWLSGLDDAVEGHPNIDLAIPEFLRDRAEEPVLLLCHEPDFVDVACRASRRLHPSSSSSAATRTADRSACPFLPLWPFRRSAGST